MVTLHTSKWQMLYIEMKSTRIIAENKPLFIYTKKEKTHRLVHTHNYRNRINNYNEPSRQQTALQTKMTAVSIHKYVCVHLHSTTTKPEGKVHQKLWPGINKWPDSKHTQHNITTTVDPHSLPGKHFIQRTFQWAIIDQHRYCNKSFCVCKLYVINPGFHVREISWSGNRSRG